MSKPFGKFESLGAFLKSYAADKEKEFAVSLEGLSVSDQVDRIKKQPKDRNVVEVRSLLETREEDDTDNGSHYHLLISIQEILETDPDVNEDVEKCMNEGLPVFVAIRYGDSQGIQEPIDGLEAGAKLRLRGEWIPKEEAYSHGGEKRSVLHFTHRPIGFICVEETCYR